MLWPRVVEYRGEDGDDDMATVSASEPIDTSQINENAYAAMMKAPEIRIGLRPALSTQMTAGMVARNMLWQRRKLASYKNIACAYTIPTTPVANRDTVFPVRPRDWKIDGA